MVIADAGFWVALYSRGDRDHRKALAAADQFEVEGYITTHPVIAEACHLLSRRDHAEVMVGFVEALHAARIEVFSLTSELLPRTASLMRKYINLPMDYADASLVLLAEHLGHGRILTTDKRDFGSYRWKSHYPFENLLETPN